MDYYTDIFEIDTCSQCYRQITVFKKRLERCREAFLEKTFWTINSGKKKRTASKQNMLKHIHSQILGMIIIHYKLG